MSRRARGEGTVLRDGDSWIARIELPPGPDGKRRRRKRRARTKSEAHEALREMQREAEQLVDPKGQRRLVAQAVAEYLASQPKAGRAENTIYLAEWRGRLITEGLGHRQLGSLSVRDCDTFLVQLANGEYGKRPMGRDAVGRTRSLMIAVLKNEMRQGNVVHNVGELSLMPTIGSDTRPLDEDGDDLGEDRRRSLSYDEFAGLRSNATQPMLTIIELVGRNGLRPSEARALRWGCVDLDDLTLTVNRQMSSKDKLTKTKTRRARRTISIDGQTANCLLDWRSHQAEAQRRAGDRWRDRAGLIVTTSNGTPINRNNLNRTVQRLSERLGIERILPYELRHTAITVQLDAGHELWRVAAWAGTSERMIELIYRHKLARVTELGPVARTQTGVDQWGR